MRVFDNVELRSMKDIVIEGAAKIVESEKMDYGPAVFRNWLQCLDIRDHIHRDIPRY